MKVENYLNYNVIRDIKRAESSSVGDQWRRAFLMAWVQEEGQRGDDSL
jgi:hypothetical protein